MIEELTTSNKKEAYEREQYYITSLQSVELGYNMDLGYGWAIADRRGANNPMYGKQSPNAKAVSIQGRVYPSTVAAAKGEGVNRATIVKWCNSSNDKYKEMYFI